MDWIVCLHQAKENIREMDRAAFHENIVQYQVHSKQGLSDHDREKKVLYLQNSKR